MATTTTMLIENTPERVGWLQAQIAEHRCGEDGRCAARGCGESWRCWCRRDADALLASHKAAGGAL